MHWKKLLQVSAGNEVPRRTFLFKLTLEFWTGLFLHHLPSFLLYYYVLHSIVYSFKHNSGSTLNMNLMGQLQLRRRQNANSSLFLLCPQMTAQLHTELTTEFTHSVSKNLHWSCFSISCFVIKSPKAHVGWNCMWSQVLPAASKIGCKDSLLINAEMKEKMQCCCEGLLSTTMREVAQP